MAERTTGGKPIRMLNTIDEYTRECLAIDIGGQIRAPELLYQLSELFVLGGAPDYLRSHNGTEFTAEMVRSWLHRLGVKTSFIEPRRPWELNFTDPAWPKRPDGMSRMTFKQI